MKKEIILNDTYQNKEWLYDKYHVEKLSAESIAKIAGCRSSTILKWMKRHNIVRRTLKEGLINSRNKNILEKLNINEIWLRQEYIDKKLSMLDISKKIGCQPSSIRQCLIECRIPRRNTSKKTIDRTIYNKDWLYTQYIVNNISIKEIAKIVNHSQIVIREWLINDYIPLKTLEENIMNNPTILVHKSGEAHHGFGKPISDEIKENIRKTNAVYDRTVYTKEWLYNKYYNELQSAKQIATLIGCKQVTIRRWMQQYGFKMRTFDEGAKLNRVVTKKPRGAASHLWRGGKVNLYNHIRTCAKSIIWRKSILERDEYSCVKCFCIGGDFEIDHIKPLALIVQEYKITTLEEAEACDELFDTKNGRTLCKICHKKTDTYGQKTKKLLEEIRRII